MQDIAARTQHHTPILSVVLTVAEPIDGVWQLSITVDGEDEPDWCVDDNMTSLTEALDIRVEDNSDAAAAAAAAVDAIHVEYELDVTSIVYPNGPDLSVVLTVAEPIDGVWQLYLTKGGAPFATNDFMNQLAWDTVTTDTDSDANAAGEHAADLLRDDFDVVVDTIVYPDGTSIDCDAPRGGQ